MLARKIFQQVINGSVIEFKLIKDLQSTFAGSSSFAHGHTYI